MAQVQLALHDVSIGFGPEALLSHVDLEVGRGERIVLIGPSGQGKTVLLKLFAGLLLPTQGEVRIDGLKLGEDPELSRKMGMLFQKNALFDSLSCGENIAFPLREKSQLTEAEIQAQVEKSLEEVGLGHAGKLFPAEISGGMQKRLGIARALALKPQIVLYDDPTAGLDPITSRLIVELILRLQSENKSTIIAVTNDMARAYQLADRIVMVVDGEAIVTGNKTQTLAHKDPRVKQFVRGELEGPLTEETA